MNSKIDFVLYWVDESDEIWKKEKRMYENPALNIDNNSPVRFRNWDNLKYWFRAVEKNAPWVNNIYFITYGHLPSWLNTENEKLKVIKHKDYMPQEYLPTYNSSAIELNLYRIKDLSNNFVLFNDDMFLLEKVDEADFFKNDLPVEIYSECTLTAKIPNRRMTHVLLNNISIINKYFDKKEVYKKHLFKYFNLKYGLKANISTALLCGFNNFCILYNPHLPVALKKDILSKIWDLEFETLDTTSKNKFRKPSDVNQYIIRYWQLASSKFYPKSYKFGKAYDLQDDNTGIINEIKKKKFKAVCFNDCDDIKDFELSKATLNKYLESKFPEKSRYEK
jgi:hypothetical protein